jgi:hypothetical protein
MKSAVVNMMRCTPGSIIASNRIAKFLAAHVGCPLIDNREACVPQDLDRVYVVNGPMLYCNFRPEMQALVNRAKQVVWVENDYAIQMPGFIKAREPVILSACEDYRESLEYGYVNWNQLTFEKDIQPTTISREGLLYYGAFRKGREKYFKKYLASDLYPTHISCSRPAAQKFFAIAPKARYFETGNVMAFLGAYRAVLYIEDVRSHECYTSPANRFYEALSTYTLQLFDKSVIGTFDKAGIDVRPWVVDSPEEVAHCLSSSLRLLDEQVETLRAVDYKKRLENELSACLKALDA